MTPSRVGVRHHPAAVEQVIRPAERVAARVGDVRCLGPGSGPEEYCDAFHWAVTCAALSWAGYQATSAMSPVNHSRRRWRLTAAVGPGAAKNPAPTVDVGAGSSWQQGPGRCCLRRVPSRYSVWLAGPGRQHRVVPFPVVDRRVEDRSSWIPVDPELAVQLPVTARRTATGRIPTATCRR